MNETLTNQILITYRSITFRKVVDLDKKLNSLNFKFMFDFKLNFSKKKSR